MVKDDNFSDFTAVVHGTPHFISEKDVRADKKLRFRWSNEVIAKMLQTTTKVMDFFDGYKGDVNLGIKKEFFSDVEIPNSLPLIRGVQLNNYSFYGSEQWCEKQALSKNRTHLERIVFQEISNMGTSRRIKATILQNVILGDSVNFIIPNTSHSDISLIASLAIVNSKVINYFFKFFSQTNHIPIGDFKQIPFPELSPENVTLLENLVAQIFSIKEHDVNGDISSLENMIDFIVYHLYNLSYDEVIIVDPDTPITREQYENHE